MLTLKKKNVERKIKNEQNQGFGNAIHFNVRIFNDNKQLGTRTVQDYH